MFSKLQKRKKPRIDSVVIMPNIPSFWSGLNTIFKSWGSPLSREFSQPPEVMDRIALYQDWKVVGDDIKKALIEFQ